MNPGNFQISARGDKDILMTRDFDAPRHLVFDAFTKPELVSRWLLGPDGWTMPVCEIDLRAGGRYRYVWRKDKTEMSLGGTYRVVVRPERIVHTEKFEQPWYEGEALVTTAFVEQGGKTTVSMTISYDSRQTRDTVLKSGMERGVARSYERLEEILAATASARS